MQRALYVAVLQPAGHHGPAQRAREQVGAAAKGGHQFGFQIGRVQFFGAQPHAVRARRAGFVAILAGECDLPRLGLDPVQHHARAIDLRARGGQL